MQSSMKKILFTALILSTTLSYAQNDIKLKPFRIWYNVAIGKEGYTNPDASAILDLGKDTTNKGVLLPKVLLDSVATTKRGLFVYNLLDSTLYHFDGTDVTRYMTYRDTALIKQLITTYAPQPDLSGIRDSTAAAYDTFSVHWAQIYANYVAIQSRATYTALADTALSIRSLVASEYFKNGGTPWAGTWTLGSTTNQPGRIYVNSANVMDFFSGGNVGIGTGGTNAGYKFDINGTARISGAFQTGSSNILGGYRNSSRTLINEFDANRYAIIGAGDQDRNYSVGLRLQYRNSNGDLTTGLQIHPTANVLQNSESAATSSALNILTTDANSLQGGLSLRNPNGTESGGTAVGLMFLGGSSINKGAIAYEIKSSWARGDMHFLQRSTADGNAVSLSDAAITIKNNKNIITYGTMTLVVSEYADNAAALAGGLTAGQVYRTGDILKIVH